MPGVKVTIKKNNKISHHDVTARDPSLVGMDAIVVKAPVYPNTWVTLRSVDTDKIVKVRTSQLIPIGGQ